MARTTCKVLFLYLLSRHCEERCAKRAPATQQQTGRVRRSNLLHKLARLADWHGDCFAGAVSAKRRRAWQSACNDDG